MSSLSDMSLSMCARAKENMCECGSTACGYSIHHRTSMPLERIAHVEIGGLCDEGGDLIGRRRAPFF